MLSARFYRDIYFASVRRRFLCNPGAALKFYQDYWLQVVCCRLSIADLKSPPPHFPTRNPQPANATRIRASFPTSTARRTYISLLCGVRLLATRMPVLRSETLRRQKCPVVVRIGCVRLSAIVM